MNINIILSKSWLNRALIIYAQYFLSRINKENHSHPHFSIENAEKFKELICNLRSDSEDVQYLSNALINFFKGEKKFYLGQGGTSFRFFIIFISRFSGEWEIEIHPRLMQRPNDGVKQIFKEMNIDYSLLENTWIVRSNGWPKKNVIIFQEQVSSQFLSGFILNCWNLNYKQVVKIKNPIVSEAYLNMTIDIIKKFGNQIHVHKSILQTKIIINQCESPDIFSKEKPEIDISSAFSICAAAVLSGHIKLTNWNRYSSQPDVIFLKIFKLMQIEFIESDDYFEIQQQIKWKSLNANLADSPDLFPVLAVLCSFAEGNSVLNGAGHLQFKESNRILKTNELINAIGIQTQLLPDGLKIYGNPELLYKIKFPSNINNKEMNKKIVFDPDHDHRMAMSAGILKKIGFNIDILNPEVVNKSYPNFWNDLESLK